MFIGQRYKNSKQVSSFSSFSNSEHLPSTLLTTEIKTIYSFVSMISNHKFLNLELDKKVWENLSAVQYLFQYFAINFTWSFSRWLSVSNCSFPLLVRSPLALVSFGIGWYEFILLWIVMTGTLTIDTYDKFLG